MNHQGYDRSHIQKHRDTGIGEEEGRYQTGVKPEKPGFPNNNPDDNRAAASDTRYNHTTSACIPGNPGVHKRRTDAQKNRRIHQARQQVALQITHCREGVIPSTALTPSNVIIDNLKSVFRR